MTSYETEEIIWLINKGFDLDLLSTELDTPIERIEECKKQLDLRKSVNEAIKRGRIAELIERLNNFIENSENNIVERAILLKLNAYVNRTDINEQDLQAIEEEGKNIGLSVKIDEVLTGLGIEIPKRKNIKNKIKEDTITTEEQVSEKTSKNYKKIKKQDYDETIKKYKEEIAIDPEDQLKRNLLAFAYFEAGRIDEARNELLDLIEEYNNHTAYIQLIRLEKEIGQYKDAKSWAYECIDCFPNATFARKQLISIAKIEKNDQEVLEQLEAINRINTENMNRLEEIIRRKKEEEERKKEEGR